MGIFFHHQKLGPVVAVMMCIGASVAIWYWGGPNQGQKIESIALACAAIGMFWAAWGSRGTAIAGRGQLMPVIDIKLLHPEELGRGTDPPRLLNCRLTNVGNGPALSVSAQCPLQESGHELKDLGALGSGDHFPQQGFSVTKRNGSPEISVRYKDVFDQKCESRREISRDTATGLWVIGPLKVQCK